MQIWKRKRSRMSEFVPSFAAQHPWRTAGYRSNTSSQWMIVSLHDHDPRCHRKVRCSFCGDPTALSQVLPRLCWLMSCCPKSWNGPSGRCRFVTFLAFLPENWACFNLILMRGICWLSFFVHTVVYARVRQQFSCWNLNFLGNCHLQWANSQEITSFGSTHILRGQPYLNIIEFKGNGRVFKRDTCVGS